MEDISKKIHEGMEVYAADGVKVGKIKQVWFGVTASGPPTSEEETCMEVHRGLLGREALYLPCRIATGVSANRVDLSVDSHTVSETPTWHRRPAWVG